MWIISKILQLSNGAPDTEAFISDLNEQSQICASSLMVRSKLSPARTWSQKWKRDSWTRHLSGRILKPSHAKSFVTEWTCLWPVTPASHLAQQGSGSEQKTLDTSGHTLPDQFELFALDSVSLKMSKDTSRWDSPASSATWKSWVTRCRGEYSLRVKSAHLTNASGCLSWPTARSRDWKDSGNLSQTSYGMTLGRMAQQHGKDAWQTPTTNMDMVRSEEGIQKRKEFRASIGRKSIPDGNLGEQMQRVIKHGHPAPANPSTDGSRQESSVASQQNWQTFAHGTHNRGETPHRQVVRALVHGDKAKTQCLTVDQVFAEEIKGTNPRQESWRTPSSSDGEGGVMEMREGCAGKYKLRDHVAAEQKKSWATPNNFCFQPPENTEQWTKRAEYQQTEKGVNLHKPIQSQVLHENEKVMGAMPPSAAKLNPRWVETLMGLPIGWTMPSCKSPVTIELTNCDCLETESCLPQPSEHLELF